MKIRNLVILLTTVTFTLATPFTQAAEQTLNHEILFLGDSITFGLWVKTDQAFPALLQNKLLADGINNVKIISAGLPGAKTTTAVSRLKAYIASTPGLTSLVLELGANDGMEGAELFNIHLNLRNTIDLAEQNHLSVLILGMKLPLNYEPAYRQVFEQIFSDVAEETQSLLVPYLLEGVGGIPSLNVSDGLHPNPAGHIILSETVYPYLRLLLERPRP